MSFACAHKKLCVCLYVCARASQPPSTNEACMSLCSIGHTADVCELGERRATAPPHSSLAFQSQHSTHSRVAKPNTTALTVFQSQHSIHSSVAKPNTTAATVPNERYLSYMDLKYQFERKNSIL